MKNKFGTVITESMEPTVERPREHRSSRYASPHTERLPLVEAIQKFEEMPDEDKVAALTAAGCLVLGVIGALLVIANRDHNRSQGR